MQLVGSRVLHAPREAVWALLAEPPRLQSFIPGCESLSPQPDGAGYDAVVAARIGPVAARFKGTFTLDETDPPAGYRLRFQGAGGASGFASGEARVRLVQQGPSTELSYAVEARVGGKLAQVGSRLIDATAAKLADEFFDRMASRFPAPQPEPAPVTAPPPQAASGRAAMRRWLIAGSAVLLAALVWLAVRSG